MKHFRTRYTLEKLTTTNALSLAHGLIYAVVDHQTGEYRAKGLTWNSAHNLIDKLTGFDTSEPVDEYPELADGWRTRSNIRSGMFGGR